MASFSREDLEKAWEKTRYDIEMNHFLDEPIALDLIEANRDEFIEDLKEKLDNGEYSPSRSKIIDAPKGGWRVRPATWLSIEDSVVFTALVLDIFEDIQEKLTETKGDIRISHQIIDDFLDTEEWFEGRTNTWSEFKQKSLERASDEEIKHVVETDISGYYENIGIDRLMHDIRSISEMSESKRELLEECLTKWAKPRDRGIPQGYSSSDLLAEIYLHSFDEIMEARGIEHYRFNDDVRVFCESKTEAIESLKKITNLFRDRGLNLNSGKTNTMTAEESLNKYSGSSEKIEALKADIQEELPETVEVDPGPYSTPKDIQKMKERAQNIQDEEELEIEALTTAFEDEIKPKGSGFDSTMFHYVLNRMASMSEATAMNFCINVMPSRPEETNFIIQRYLAELEYPDRAEARDKLAEKIISEKLHYEYQVFHIIKWFLEDDIESSKTLEAARKVLFDRSYGDISRHLENYCMVYVSIYGSRADLEEIIGIFEETDNDIKEATIIEALKDMESVRKNQVYDRANSDNFYVEKSIERCE
jgi:hypothetical protein